MVKSLNRKMLHSSSNLGEIYMNSMEQVYVVRQRDFFGPLIPQEIKELVITKYRKDMFLKWYNY